MTTEASSCGDCGGPNHEIRILDETDFAAHTDLRYAAIDAKQGFWTKKFPIDGRVAARMCQSCGRITLYGIATG